MTEAALNFETEQRELDRRVGILLASHNGDWRAAIETLLVVTDQWACQVSVGYMRGRAAFDPETVE